MPMIIFAYSENTSIAPLTHQICKNSSKTHFIVFKALAEVNQASYVSKANIQRLGSSMGEKGGTNHFYTYN